MTAATRGQAEYETWRAAVPEIVCNVPAGPWEDLPETVRAGFAAIAARQHDNLTAATWRQGRDQPRNIYAQTGDDWKAHPLIGHMDTAELAAIACEARNAHGHDAKDDLIRSLRGQLSAIRALVQPFGAPDIAPEAASREALLARAVLDQMKES